MAEKQASENRTRLNYYKNYNNKEEGQKIFNNSIQKAPYFIETSVSKTLTLLEKLMAVGDWVDKESFRSPPRPDKLP